MRKDLNTYLATKKDERSARSLATLRKRLSRFETWQREQVGVNTPSSEQLEDYRNYLKTDLAYGTTKLRNELAAVGDYLDWIGPSQRVLGAERDPSDFVVGIGASAGGLEALERFFGAPDIDPRLSYVVVQHLSPDFKSMMPQILARVTSIPMASIEDGMPLEPGTIYLNNPRTDVRIKNDCFEQREPPLAEHTLHLPINTFFSSLAETKRTKAVGIILSGTGRDGSEGVADIHQQGGLVLTQDARSALFGSMPESAAARGPTHFTLDPAEMPGVINDYILKGVPPRKLDPLDRIVLNSENAFSYLLSLLQRAYGIDFSRYKNATLERRVERRMSLGGEHSLEVYVSRLQNDPDELDALYRDMLVDVTQFFRDKEAFEFLGKEVIPEIVEKKEAGSNLRVWSAACASGEEAYSLAMLFQNEIERQQKDVELKMFATDAHKDSVMRAGAGIYKAKSFVNVPPGLRDKYFTREPDGRYKVRKRLRQKIIFAPHDLLSDGSFSNLDFVSCRNILIYLRPEAQLSALTQFTNGLSQSGILFLGSSEHLGKLREHYAVLSEKWRIYQKLRSVALNHVALASPSVKAPRGSTAKTEVLSGVERNLLKRLLTAACVVDAQGQLVETIGDANRYLRVPSGKLTLSLSAMLDEPLATSIKSGLFTAQRSNERLDLSTTEIVTDAGKQFVDVSIIPFEVDVEGEGSRYYLVQFRQAQPLSDAGETVQNEPRLDRLQGLERELEFTRESLQASLEEVETTNEELQSTNEELIASNEELQSTNEELSSVNEELITVNAEFQSQNRRLNQINSDLENLMRNTETVAVFLDQDLKLRMITPAAYEVFGLLETDVGRSVTQFAPFISFGRGMISGLAQKALEGVRSTRTVTLDAAVAGRYIEDTRLQLSVMPYTTVEDEIDGAVLRFVDITEAERQVRVPLQERAELAESLRSSVPVVIYVYSVSDDKNLFATEDICELLGYSPEEIKGFGEGFLAVLIHPEDKPGLEEHLRNVAKSTAGEMLDFSYRLKNKAGEWQWLRSHDTVLECDEDGGAKTLIGYVNNVNAERKLNRYSAYTAALFESDPDCLQLIDQNGRLFGMNANGCDLCEIDEFETVYSTPWRDLWLDKDQIDKAIEKAKEEGQATFKADAFTQKGTRKTWEVKVVRVDAPEGDGYFFLSSSRVVEALN